VSWGGAAPCGCAGSLMIIAGPLTLLAEQQLLIAAVSQPCQLQDTPHPQSRCTHPTPSPVCSRHNLAVDLLCCKLCNYGCVLVPTHSPLYPHRTHRKSTPLPAQINQSTALRLTAVAMCAVEVSEA
jgi:hypothetical protein